MAVGVVEIPPKIRVERLVTAIRSKYEDSEVKDGGKRLHTPSPVLALTSRAKWEDHKIDIHAT